VKEAQMSDDAKDDGKLRIKLSKQYDGLNDSFDELVFREPRAKDFIMGGIPVDLVPTADSFQVKFHPQEMTMFMAGLSGRLPADIQMLHPRDWMAGAYAMVPFFVPG